VKKRPPIDRPKQHLPADIVGDIQHAIRSQFYPDSFLSVSSVASCSKSPWFSDQNFIKREFTLYLATWLDKRGVTLKPERYKALLLGLLNEIKAHGKTDAIKYWPGYLKHVLQQHLKHHGEDIYQEAKSLRTLAENTLLNISKLGGANAAAEPTLDPIAVMAAARRDLLLQKRTKRPSKTKTTQLDLL
jgi:hypothetical protein